MLAERMAAGVASGAYQIEHLAAVTFTRKAASELRGRGPCQGGARKPRAILRRNDPLLLRPPAARAAGRVRRLTWPHRAG
jgi:hypothetical protein